LEIPDENPDNQITIDSQKKTRLDNRLLKVWQITTTVSPTALDDEMADKEAAYGLKGVNDPVAIRGELVFKRRSL
jgi:hypothetical protein